jgi:phage N-6-adenine-methyltransferase
MAIGGHHNPKSQTNEWFTPPFVIDALGGWESFDLDPATAAAAPELRTARACFTRADNGLMRRWGGRVWCNPPYSNPEIDGFMARMAEHDRGIALIFARTETQMFFERVWERASGLLFLQGRLNFHYADGTRAKANAGAPSVLCAYGSDDRDVLAACRLGGKFVPLRLPRSMVVVALEPSWRDAIGGWLKEQRGPVKLDDLYRQFAAHPKTARNPNWRAKVRQIVQQVGARTGRAEWVMA